MKKQKLTLKQKAWLKYYLQTLNATEAARKAGYRCKNEDSYAVIGRENFIKLKDFIAEWITEIGLTPERIKLKIIQGLEAKEKNRMKLMGAINQNNLPEGRRIIATSGKLAFDKDGNEIYGDGETVIEWDEEALGIQQRYVDMACKVLSLYDSDLIQRIEEVENILERQRDIK